MNVSKTTIRRECKEKRALIEDKEERSIRIAQRLFQNERYINADIIYLYASQNDEVFTDAIAKKAERDGKETAYPLCADRDGDMIFYFSHRHELIKGMYGIFEPDRKKSKPAFSTGRTLCIVPGLAFDKLGYRIGYGKGYYDRFLSKFSGYSIGLCFEECMHDTLPIGPYDKKVDCVLTENNTYMITKEE